MCWGVATTRVKAARSPSAQLNQCLPLPRALAIVLPARFWPGHMETTRRFPESLGIEIDGQARLSQPLRGCGSRGAEMRIILTSSALLLALALMACNTIEGAGRDIS